MFCIGNYLLQMFAPEGFVKACMVSLIDSYMESVGNSQADRAGLDKGRKFGVKSFQYKNMLGLCYTFSTWHHTQSFLHGAVPRSHREPCFSVYIYIVCVCVCVCVCVDVEMNTQNVRVGVEMNCPNKPCILSECFTNSV